MTETGSGARRERAAEAPSRDDGETSGDAGVLVWNGLVARAERAASARVPQTDPDDQAETKLCTGWISGLTG